jgi:hypothetical protein
MAEPSGKSPPLSVLALAPQAAGCRAGWLRDAMWSGAMAQLGGEHVSLSRFPGEHAVVWEHMREIWERQSDCLRRRIDLLPDPEPPSA